MPWLGDFFRLLVNLLTRPFPFKGFWYSFQGLLLTKNKVNRCNHKVRNHQKTSTKPRITLAKLTCFHLLNKNPPQKKKKTKRPFKVRQTKTPYNKTRNFSSSNAAPTAPGSPDSPPRLVASLQTCASSGSPYESTW